MIAVVDFAAGNLRSVVNAFQAIGVDVRVTSDPRDLAGAPAIVLPGVGAFERIAYLDRLQMLDALREEVLGKGKPYLGICLGMQFLGREGFEGGTHKGLGWMSGVVQRIETGDRRFRVPHVGWNRVELRRPSPLFDGLEADPVFYFVHSYHLAMDESAAEDVLGTCRHGVELTAAVHRDNIFGVQFHPEKSQQNGLRLLENFVRLV
jgi:glutamine amidotransferase